MLKARDAEEEMADVLGITHLANRYLVRLLRLIARDFWPAIGSGRRDVGVKIRHLIYNLIAHSCAPGQPSSGPRMVEEFYWLRRYQSVKRQPSWVPETPNRFWFPQSFREDEVELDTDGLRAGPLIDLVVFLVRQRMLELVGDVFWPEEKWPTIYISIGSFGQPMSAKVIYPLGDFQSFIDHYAVKADTLPRIDTPERLPAYRSQVIIGYDELLAIVAVAAKTRDFNHLGVPYPSSSGNGEGSPPPENETAASGPARDQNAAALNDQPAQTDLDRCSQSYPKGEREKSQSPSESQAGRSFEQSFEQWTDQQWSDSNARRFDGFDDHDDGGRPDRHLGAPSRRVA